MAIYIVTTVMTAVFIVLGLASMRLLKLYQRQTQRIHLLQNQLAALTAGAAGTDERILKFEQTLSKLKDHQNSMDLSANHQPGYDHAIRLAKKGADIEQLMTNCNLSNEEAHLIATLHGNSKSLH